jgi:hypothetical protein
MQILAETENKALKVLFKHLLMETSLIGDKFVALFQKAKDEDIKQLLAIKIMSEL